MRRAPVLVATAALLMTVLSGCSTDGSAAASCQSPVTDGAAAKLVSVTGEAGSAPTVSFPTPLKSGTTQRSEILPGTGPGLVSGQQVKIELSVYNGTTGAVIDASKYDGTSATSFVLNDKTIKGLAEGLQCAQVGSRVAVVVTPDDAFGPQGGNDQIGVAATDALVFVIDVVKSYLPRADGAGQPVANGLPGVVLAADGTPGISVPSGAAPTKQQIGVLKKGTGRKVAEGDTVTVHYTGVLWSEKTVFDSSWAKNGPVQFLAADGSKTQGGIIPGFANALIGQTVGSQIVTVIPPNLAYGDTAQGSIPAGSTLIFVADILGTD
ncbi:FKBP-type peptidyl-prolyl cis-trans isomerase [Cryobacterium sp. PH31-AA6]|uniref:FKBP-type peptidyl-prolyl cis-trans isomerase n=1 Tax=Cryobacterium sp. PH31-AA6 TaxID=3046205 RepID=UPI0024B93024|nr:FKBP-type peptidyl-prolyl cis-trans isomerase [Cryobacterium sp. PH31-AA6]MDJ0322626.1 FKBP-type peptidyl-prolyl cis-trans isomerase [Cryobacterium sp. PH31-AA6]